jgi:hypothetical protein
MSIADQAKFVSIIEEVLNVYFEQKGEAEGLTEDRLGAFITILTGILGKHVQKLMELVLDPEEITAEDYFKDVTNLQMSKIFMGIVEDNFEEPAKNVMGLVDRFKDLFLLTRPSPSFLNDTDNLDSRTSSENLSEKEE